MVIVGVTSSNDTTQDRIFDLENVRSVERINPYIVSGYTTYVEPSSVEPPDRPRMVMGSMPRDGGYLILTPSEARECLLSSPSASKWIRKYVGADELIKGTQRRCLWIADDEVNEARKLNWLAQRLDSVANMRAESSLASTNEFADKPHRFVYLAGNSLRQTVAVAGVSSETRQYLPVDLLDAKTVVSNAAFSSYDAPLWTFSVIASTLHKVWIAAVCGKLETRYRYSNTLGWNTFPLSKLTAQNRADLTRCAENILLAREAHFPATIADLYDPEKMPDDLRRAHEANDEVLERIYIGRRFRNDTERLEKLFELYAKMTTKKAAA